MLAMTDEAQKPLSTLQILATEDDEKLLELLTGELQRLLPEELQEDRNRFHEALNKLPRGIRAMAGIHEFDVSMALDSLAWHFGNQNDERDLRETLNGLRELELPQIAEMFEQMWEFMKPHMNELQSGDFGGKDFSDWLVDIGAEDFADKKDKYIWDYSKKAGELGLLQSWVTYARKYPERCMIAG
jgi:hypothetical protein